MTSKLKVILIAFVACFNSQVEGQWVEENYALKAGWNAIWLSHDTSHATIDNLLMDAIPIEEIWHWNTLASSTQFTTSPVAPVSIDTQWLVWKRGLPAETTMSHLVANGAYLVKVADSTPNLNLTLKGRPVPPDYPLSSSGLNFIGFPAQEPESVTARNFTTFLSFNQDFDSAPDVFSYRGGPIENNPVKVLSQLFEPVTRGKAYWIQSDRYSEFYGPLKVTVASNGLDFGATRRAVSLRIQNITTNPVTATLTPAASATPPPSQEGPIAGQVPLRIRSALDPTTGGFTFDALSAPADYLIESGEEVEIVFAVDRSSMAGAPGTSFQSLLQVTDSEQMTRIDLPVRAITSSRSGLWIGEASLSQVDQITAAPAPLPNGLASVDVTTDADADAPAEFKVRLIIHRADDGTVKLLQQAYLGKGLSGETIVTPDPSLLDPTALADARRVSSSTFPLDQKIQGSGADLGLSGTTSFTSLLPYTASTNPFVHTYHPDHDNKDRQFSATLLPSGVESPDITRNIELTFLADAPGTSIDDLAWGSTLVGGDYQEVVSGLRAQDITIKGSFVLQKVSPISSLTE